MGSLFYGLNEVFNKPGIPAKKDPIPASLITSGQVIDVCLDESSSLYESIRDIGKVIFRNLYTEVNKFEDEIKNIAYPLDRSIQRYPMPGEEIIVFTARGEKPSKSKNAIGSLYFYAFVVSSENNITYNSNPFLGTNSSNVKRPKDETILNLLLSPDTDPSDEEKNNKIRFEKITKDINLVKTLDNKIKCYKQLKPFEGDFILQGRFGNSIRFGSTSDKIKTPWSSEISSGTSGDGIMILRVDRDISLDEENMLTVENIDTDDTSIYLTTTQTVPIELASSDKILQSWLVNYEIEASTTGEDPLGNNLIPEAPLHPTGDLDSTEAGSPPVEGQINVTTVINVPQLNSASFFEIPNTQFDIAPLKKTNRLLKESMGIQGNKNVYDAGSQLILNSDRVIVNSKSDYLLLFGEQGVAVSSPGNVNIDAKDDVTIYSGTNLFLGLPGKNTALPNEKPPKNLAQPTTDKEYEPLVLGLKLANFLEDLINTIANAVILAPMGKGTLREDAKDELAFLKARIPEMLSTYGYIDGITHETVDPEPTSVHPITEPPTTLTGTTTINTEDLQSTTAPQQPFEDSQPISTELHPTTILQNYTPTTQ